MQSSSWCEKNLSQPGYSRQDQEISSTKLQFSTEGNQGSVHRFGPKYYSWVNWNIQLSGTKQVCINRMGELFTPIQQGCSALMTWAAHSLNYSDSPCRHRQPWNSWDWCFFGRGSRQQRDQQGYFFHPVQNLFFQDVFSRFLQWFFPPPGKNLRTLPISGFPPFWDDFWAPQCLKSAQNLTKSAQKRPLQAYQLIARMNPEALNFAERLKFCREC